MGTTNSLRHLLRCLCHNSHWSYAVLWKLEQMELSWEDGYFDHKKSGGFIDGKPEIISFGCEMDAKRGNSSNCPIEMAVASMSCRSYLLGEGIIGKVALYRKHHWINAGESEIILQDECPKEWHEQSVAGIKTILLVPIITLGVVQLGSLDTVMEDLREVLRVRDNFGAIQSTLETCISSLQWTEQLDLCTSSAKPMLDLPPAIDVIDEMLDVDTSSYADESRWESTFSNLFADQIREPPTLELSMFANNITEGDMPIFSGLENELYAQSSISHKLLNKPHILPNHEHNNHDEFDEEKTTIIDHTSWSFPSNSELHKALGPSSKGYEDPMWNMIVSKAGEWNNPSFEDINVCSRKERGTEELLDAVIAEFDASNENISHEPRCIKSCSNSSSKCSDSCVTQCKTEDDAFSLLASDKSSINISSITEGKDMINEHNKKGPKPTNVSRRRGNACEIQKPKPRDRQLIQDRITELRELIPDGSKCSIDALLDRTVKHMLFLQSIPHQAEKLRNSAEPKVNGKHWNSSEPRSFQNESSWAYQFGRGLDRQCPLIVENLDQPGKIIIEMQCEEYSLFLEMAQIIKRLKLSILKGVLETKLNKPWARFIVETPRGFHRMDILWPLVHLLQRNNKTISKMFY